MILADRPILPIAEQFPKSAHVGAQAGLERREHEVCGEHRADWLLLVDLVGGVEIYVVFPTGLCGEFQAQAPLDLCIAVRELDEDRGQALRAERRQRPSNLLPAVWV